MTGCARPAGSCAAWCCSAPATACRCAGLALPDAAAFATPLGQVPIDQDAVAALAGLSQVVVSSAVHAEEHALEVQLPFLQRVLGEFSLVPLAVGAATPAQVAEVIDRLWGGEETLIVISSDLSHYHPYEEARGIDRGTARAILDFSTDIDHEQACGATPVAGMLLAAKRHKLKVDLLDLRNSGDTAGGRARVVATPRSRSGTGRSVSPRSMGARCWTSRETASKRRWGCPS